MSLLAKSLNKVYGHYVYKVSLYITDLLLLFWFLCLYKYYYNNIMLMMTVNI